jgi:transcriptional regulator NrdR family protein
MSIYKYQKVVANGTTYRFIHPYVEGEQQGAELATVEGFTYVYIPDGVEIPKQHEQITEEEVSSSIEELEAVKKASRHVALINQEVQEKIAARYNTADEIKLIRTAPSTEFDAYNAYVEECRQWGREQKAKIGL